MNGLSREQRSKLMSRIGSKNTRPEMVVRRLLHRLGYRFRLHRKDLPGKPDLVLPKFKTVIFVHGCFWHGCSRCDRGTRVPKTNRDFWISKIAENRRRDERVTGELTVAGWRVVTIWACETGDEQRLTERLQHILSDSNATEQFPLEE